jgi:hypothetical protein
VLGTEVLFNSKYVSRKFLSILPNVLCPVFTMAINEWPVNERDKAYSEAGPHSI